MLKALVMRIIETETGRCRKAQTFLIAFCLLFVQAYYSCAAMAANKRIERIVEKGQAYATNNRSKTKRGKLDLPKAQRLYDQGQFSEVIDLLRGVVGQSPEVRWLLLRSYYYDYRFEEARHEAENYITTLKKKKRPTQEVEAFLTKIDRAASMLERVAKVEVIDSLVVPYSDLMMGYRGLSREVGQIEAETISGDSTHSILTSTYVDARGQRAIRAQSKGGDGATELVELRRIGSKWADAKPLTELNRTNTENFPSMKQDGVTIFFARKSPDGLGGLDLYMTRKNASTGEYMEPTLLGMPYNSLFNDFLLVYDENRGLGYFASDRYQPDGWICIYTFAIDEGITLLPTEDTQAKRNQAMLKQIALTRTSNTNYPNFTKSPIASASQAGINRVRDDFRLSVAGQSYTRWSDFRSPQAADLYRKVVDKKERLSHLLAELKEKRSLYSRANGVERQKIAEQILSLETEEDTLRASIDEALRLCLEMELHTKNE